MKEQPYKHKGEIVRCDGCGADLYRYTRDVYSGDEIKAEYFKGIDSVPDPRPCDDIACPLCEKSLAIG